MSLTADLKRRIREVGVDCEEWSCGGLDPSILLVSAEAAVTDEFARHLKRLDSSRRLFRIVIEEAHLALTSQSFRPHLKRLGTIRPSGRVPLTLLTATMPPSMEKNLSDTCMSPFRSLRAVTNRPNLRCGVHFPLDPLEGCDVRPSQNFVLQAQLRAALLICSAVEEHRGKRESARGILFSVARSKCEIMSEKVSKFVPACYYHGGMRRDGRMESERR